MHGESEIIAPYRRFFRERVAGRILGPDDRGVEEYDCVDGVAGESEDVDGVEVDCEASG